jgi:hypothetical protein
VKVLVAGPGRSGTTWVGEALSAALRSAYVHEPDNPVLEKTAQDMVASCGLWPLVAVGDDRPIYAHVWGRAFAVRPSLGTTPVSLRHRLAIVAGRHGIQRRRDVVVKSAYCAFSLEWIAERFRPAMVLVRRNPLNLVASWLQMGWHVRPDLYGQESEIVRAIVNPMGLPDKPGGSEVTLLSWWIALQLEVQERVAARHPEWTLLSHDEACRDPLEAFAAVTRRLGRGDVDRLAQYLAQANQAGSGFQTRRVTADQPANWKSFLSAEHVAEARTVFGSFPASKWRIELEQALSS